MGANRIAQHTKVLFFLGNVVVVVAFLQFGGQAWIKGLIEGNKTFGIENWNWVHILISICLGFLLGMLAFRKKAD